MTDLDELREKWMEHDRKLDAILRVNERLLAASRLNRARSAMRCLGALLAAEALIQLAVVALLGNFAADHWTQPRFALPAAAVDAVAIALLAALVRQAVLAFGIDYGKPVTSLQRDLAALRILRIRYIQWIFLTAVAVWAPLLVVMMKGFFDLDAYALFGTAYLAANLLLGLALIPLGIWASRRFGPRLGASPFVRRIADSISGHSLRTAAASMAELSEFEKGEAA